MAAFLCLSFADCYSLAALRTGKMKENKPAFRNTAAAVYCIVMLVSGVSAGVVFNNPDIANEEYSTVCIGERRLCYTGGNSRLYKSELQRRDITAGFVRNLLCHS